jgi:class 3 adenylate cyclase
MRAILGLERATRLVTHMWQAHSAPRLLAERNISTGMMNMGERTLRRLAVVASTDVVGYSRLMGIDEAATLETLRRRQTDVIDPMVATHGGHIVKTMGDGLLLEFTSAVDSVLWALEIQRGMAERNAMASDAMQIELRIGLHLGDIVPQDGDIFGDGVNLAARLQEMAEPGGICISGVVHEQIAGKIEQAFDDLGFRRLKNIDRPVRVYKARMDNSASQGELHRQWPYVTGKPEHRPLTSGGCLCGQVRFDIWGEPSAVGYCHCRYCQLALGAPLNAWAAFRRSLVSFTGESLKIFKSSPFAVRAFCGECGTSIYTDIHGADAADFYSIRLATLDNPEDFPPTCHFGVESRLPWLNIDDELPRIRTEDDALLAGCWTAIGQPKGGPAPLSARERLQSRQKDDP